MNTTPSPGILILAALSGIGLALLISRCITQSWEIDRLNASIQRSDEWARKNFKTRNGYVDGFGNYNLISLDNGKTWYNWVRDGGGITPADPALVSKLDGWDALVAHVEKNGPIGDLTDPNALKLLEGTGFTVERKPAEKP